MLKGKWMLELISLVCLQTDLMRLTSCTSGIGLNMVKSFSGKPDCWSWYACRNMWPSLDPLSCQSKMCLRAPVRAWCQREVGGRLHITPLLAPLCLSPILVCHTITPTIPCRMKGSACLSAWMTHSENWTSSRKTLRFSWRRTAGRGRTLNTVTPRSPCWTAATFRSVIYFFRRNTEKVKAADLKKGFLFFPEQLNKWQYGVKKDLQIYFLYHQMSSDYAAIVNQFSFVCIYNCGWLR